MAMPAENLATELAAVEELLSQKHPGLSIRAINNGAVVEGVVVLRSADMPFESFLVRIDLDDIPPKQQPRVFEIGGRIPKQDTHHVSSDGSLCVGVPEEIWLLLDGRFEIVRFIDDVVAPYLIGVACMLRGEAWPFGERSHGAAGICEFYGERFGTKEPAHVLDIIEVLLAKAPKGHWPCPCGSGNVIRKCHHKELSELRARRVPADILQRSANVVARALMAEVAGRIGELERIAGKMRRMLAGRAAA